MDKNDIEILRNMESEKLQEEQYYKKQQLNKDFEEASESPYFAIFNKGITTVTTIISLVVCEIFLWNYNKIFFIGVTSLIVMSCVFRYISKYYFKKGNQKKFSLFNKMAKTTGVASSVIDATVLKGTKGVHTSSKADSIESGLSDTTSTIAEMQFKGGVYTDKRYDDIRERCIRMGRYVYNNMNTSQILGMINRIKKSVTVNKTSSDSISKIHLFDMYIWDFMNKAYDKASLDLMLSMLGALFYYEHPLKDVPNSVPLVGYRDNVFALYCVYAGNRDVINEYRTWKISKMRNVLLEDAMKHCDDIWVLLVTARADKRISDEDIVSAVRNKNSNLLGDFPIQIFNNIVDLFSREDAQRYLNVSGEQVAGMRGTLLYRLYGNSVFDDNIKFDEYINLYMVVAVCSKKCSEVLESFEKWKVLKDLYESNDVLIDYLTTVIGDNQAEWRAEIDRLSKQCKDKTLKSPEDRARAVITELFCADSLQIPNDLREWAFERDISVTDAIMRIYSYIPDALKKQDNKAQQAVEYWKKYKHLF